MKVEVFFFYKTNFQVSNNQWVSDLGIPSFGGHSHEGMKHELLQMNYYTYVLFALDYCEPMYHDW